MCVKAYKVEWFLPRQAHAIREFPSCFTSSITEMQYSLSIMMQDQYLCFVCLSATDVSLTVCNSAPRLLPGHAHLLPEVQWSRWHTNCWHDSSLCMFSSFPWVILRGNTAHLCAHLETHCQHKQNLCLKLFFSSLIFFCFDSQCLFQPFSPCHGSWCQHTEWLVLLHEWSPQWSGQQGDGDR